MFDICIENNKQEFVAENKTKTKKESQEIWDTNRSSNSIQKIRLRSD